MFTIDRIEYTGNSEFMIGGRNCADRPLRMSDRLVLTKQGRPTDVALSIVRITFYGSDVTEIDPGHTAGLFFKIGPETAISLGDTLIPITQPSDA